MLPQGRVLLPSVSPCGRTAAAWAGGARAAEQPQGLPAGPATTLVGASKSGPPPPVFRHPNWGSRMGLFDWLRRLTAPRQRHRAPGPAPTRLAAGVSTASGRRPTPPSSDRRRAPIDLDAADFLPIADEEIKKAAKNLKGFGPWFGRRDLIPPADDARTRLIDRALVTNGLLDPRAARRDPPRRRRDGAAAADTRPGRAIGAKARARRRSRPTARRGPRSRRRRRPRRPSAEEAARRGVAHRKATDIVFLGRGVSGPADGQRRPSRRWTAAGLPVLTTPAELAAALGLSVPRLRWLAFHTEAATRVHYVQLHRAEEERRHARPSAPRTAPWPRPSSGCSTRSSAGSRSSRRRTASSPGRSIVTNAAAARRPGRRRQHGPGGVLPEHRLPAGPQRLPAARLLAGRGDDPGPALHRVPAAARSSTTARPTTSPTGPRGLPQGACTSPGLSNQVAPPARPPARAGWPASSA